MILIISIAIPDFSSELNVNCIQWNVFMVFLDISNGIGKGHIENLWKRVYNSFRVDRKTFEISCNMQQNTDSQRFV